MKPGVLLQTLNAIGAQPAPQKQPVPLLIEVAHIQELAAKVGELTTELKEVKEIVKGLVEERRGEVRRLTGQASPRRLARLECPVGATQHYRHALAKPRCMPA